VHRSFLVWFQGCTLLCLVLTLKKVDMPWHCFCFFAYKHINSKSVFSINWATIICEQHVCTCLCFWENNVYMWLYKKMKTPTILNIIHKTVKNLQLQSQRQWWAKYTIHVHMEHLGHSGNLLFMKIN